MRNADDPRRLAFCAALTNEFIVSTSGKTEATDLIQMVDEKWIDSAAGNQATQPYKRLEVPMHPWGPPDNPVDHALDMFRLRPDEAVLYLGPTPPPCDYFSFTLFLFVRNTNSVVPRGDWLFASIRDPLNNARIQTEAGPSQPFGVNTMVIFTADQTTYQAVTNAAQQAGYPASMLNLYTLPASELYLGVEPGTRPDTLVGVLRTANFTDPAAGQAYLTNTNYAAVYRVTPRTARDLNALRTARLAGPGIDQRVGVDRAAGARMGRHERAGPIEAGHREPHAPCGGEVLQLDPLVRRLPRRVGGQSGVAGLSPVRCRREFRHHLPADRNRSRPGDQFHPRHQRCASSFTASTTPLRASPPMPISRFTATGSCPPAPHSSATRISTQFGCGDPIWNGVVGLNNRSYAGSAAQYLPDDPVATNLLYAVMVVRSTLVAQRSGAGLVLGWSYGTLEAADDVSGPVVGGPRRRGPELHRFLRLGARILPRAGYPTSASPCRTRPTRSPRLTSWRIGSRSTTRPLWAIAPILIPPPVPALPITTSSLIAFSGSN